LAAPCATIVNGTGYQFLAGTGLTGQQHADRAVQHLADQLVDAAHGLALTQQAVTAGAGRTGCGCNRFGLAFTLGGRGAQALQELQLGQGKTTELSEGSAETLQGTTLVAGHQQQAAGMTGAVMQWQAQQAAPGALVFRQAGNAVQTT